MDTFLFLTLAPAFIFGTLIGSFLNVVILRLHTGRGLGGRSHCMSCGSQLKGKHLVPMLSYLVQRGRCAACTSRITSQYFIVELLTGLLFMLAVLMGGGFDVVTALLLVLLSALVVIFVYDIRHTIIPQEPLLLLWGVSAIYVIQMNDLLFPLTQIYHVLAALGTFLFFGFFWLVSKGRWMGLGDAKLAAPLALMLGPVGAVSMVLLAFWIGTLYVLLAMSFQKLQKKFSSLCITDMHFYSFRYTMQYTMKSEVPFAPFIIIGFLLVLFFSINVFDIIQILADALTRASF